MFDKINISFADKIAAAKKQTTNKNDISETPSQVKGSPGDSKVPPADTADINKSGDGVNNAIDDSKKGTSPSNMEKAGPKDINYERPNDSEYPKDQDPRVKKPVPKAKKSFTERLIEKVAMSKMKSMMKTPGGEDGEDSNNPDAKDPDRAKQPKDSPRKRPNTKGFDPSVVGGVTDPGMPDQSLMDGVIDMRSSVTPEYSEKKYNNDKPYVAPKLPSFNPQSFMKFPKMGR